VQNSRTCGRTETTRVWTLVSYVRLALAQSTRYFNPCTPSSRVGSRVAPVLPSTTIQGGHVMGLPQLVGLHSAFCHKPVASIAEGTFCASCGNPVHLTCRQLGGTLRAGGRCEACGGDVESPIGMEIRAAREAEVNGSGIQVICPKCGSTHGFRPLQGADSSRADGIIFFGLLPWLLWLLTCVAVAGGPAGELECFKCQCVFRPRNRLRELGCLAVLVLLTGGLITLAVLSGGARP
jgi:hypothetical protein